MRLIVTLIAATAFTLHFLWGCCAHHVHAVKGVACLNPVQAVHCHDGSAHESPDPCGQLPDDTDSPCPGQHTSDCHCIFMAAGKTVVAKAGLTVSVPLALAEPSPLRSAASLNACALDSGSLIGFPVRIHLFHQVLLI